MVPTALERASNRNQASSIVDGFGVLIQTQCAIFVMDIDVADDDSAVLGGQHPRRKIRVMLEPRQDDLVSLIPGFWPRHETVRRSRSSCWRQTRSCRDRLCRRSRPRPDGLDAIVGHFRRWSQRRRRDSRCGGSDSLRFHRSHAVVLGSRPDHQRKRLACRRLALSSAGNWDRSCATVDSLNIAICLLVLRLRAAQFLIGFGFDKLFPRCGNWTTASPPRQLAVVDSLLGGPSPDCRMGRFWRRSPDCGGSGSQTGRLPATMPCIRTAAQASRTLAPGVPLLKTTNHS